MYGQAAAGELKIIAAHECPSINLLVFSIEQAELQLILVLRESKLDAVAAIAMRVRRPRMKTKSCVRLVVGLPVSGEKERFTYNPSNCFRLFASTRLGHDS